MDAVSNHTGGGIYPEERSFRDVIFDTVAVWHRQEFYLSLFWTASMDDQGPCVGRRAPRAKKSDLPKAGRCRWESGVPVQAALVPSGEVPLPWARVPQSMETPMTMSQTARK